MNANFGTQFFSELCRHVEAESSTTCFARAVILRAVELIEDLCLVALANTDASILYLKGNFIFFVSNAERYATLFGILYRVRNEVLLFRLVARTLCIDRQRGFGFQ